MTDYMKQGGKGVFFSTHITSDLDKVADMIILINRGKVVFEQDKDALLDSHRLVKGGARELSKAERDLFLHSKTTDYGFTGLTKRLPEVKKRMPDIVVERPSMEDIMLGYVEGGRR